MERILALQSLSEFSSNDDLAFDSNFSAGCSDASSGTGRSSCSVGCGKEAEMDW
jgi:hypothetical protein